MRKVSQLIEAFVVNREGIPIAKTTVCLFFQDEQRHSAFYPYALFLFGEFFSLVLAVLLLGSYLASGSKKKIQTAVCEVSLLIWRQKSEPSVLRSSGHRLEAPINGFQMLHSVQNSAW